MLFFFGDIKAYHTCNSGFVGFEFGGYYRIGKHIVKCIRSTVHGFNFLNIKTSTVVFKSHYYPIKITSIMYNRLPVIKDDHQKIFFCDNRFRKIPDGMFIPLNPPKVKI